ncbi:hypothetical protein PN499_02130 [Kamptonema animale CS-326]|uniref:hypothetical protein n=1 Tax=Kamptonema animale TaxID=92934 RepID=UPI00232A80BD|nr:hypothetical protein [Kamptonema animale]MDB9510005.1 hypothetical protein [Kamptonema animale CS-326]
MKRLHCCLTQAIPTALLMENKCLRYWRDKLGINPPSDRSLQFWARTPALGVIAQSS